MTKKSNRINIMTLYAVTSKIFNVVLYVLSLEYAYFPYIKYLNLFTFLILNWNKMIQMSKKKHQKIKTYIGQHASRLSDKESARELRGHPSSLARNTRTSCCNRTSSRRRLTVLDENALSWSNSADTFASMDCSIIWWYPSGQIGNLGTKKIMHFSLFLYNTSLPSFLYIYIYFSRRNWYLINQKFIYHKYQIFRPKKFKSYSSFVFKHRLL